jgi:hypothetical protein
VVGDFEGVVGELSIRWTIISTIIPLTLIPPSLASMTEIQEEMLDRDNVPLIQLPRRPQLTPPTKKAIPSNSHRNLIAALLLAWIGDWVGTEEIAADDDFGLDDGFATEDDVGCADYLGAPGDFIACVLGGVSCERR